MEPEPQQRNVQQHYVTAAYLAGFTPDGTRDSQLYVYERKTEKTFRLIPDEAAKQRNYYSIPKRDGDFDDRVDAMLTGLEGQAMPVLRKLVAKNYNVSTFERALLAYLIAFQEFRTPWARANFQKMELSLAEQLFHFSAKVPGYMERTLEELKKEGKVDGSVTADQIRESFKNERIKLVAKRHAGIDLMVSTSQTVGNIYTQMAWSVFHVKENGQFLTSDTPVVRRNPGFRGGFYGAGLMSSDAEVWFPLSKSACLLIRHDAEKMKKFDELLEARKMKEMEALRAELTPIKGVDVPRRLFVNAVNGQTVANADRFVYSPVESQDLPRLLKGESENRRIVVSSPFSKGKEQ
jgi:hypothetical protein